MRYFQSHVLGPQQGLDPYYQYYPVFTPDYAAFYQPIPAADMATSPAMPIPSAKPGTTCCVVN